MTSQQKQTGAPLACRSLGRSGVESPALGNGLTAARLWIGSSLQLPSLSVLRECGQAGYGIDVAIVAEVVSREM